MIYADSSRLDGLAVVVLDEVHFLQDRYRGSVWEEVIIHLPRHIQLVSLSATVANADELTEWVEARRGETVLVEESHRPVPLESVYMVEDRHRERVVEMFPVFDRSGRRPNPAVVSMLRKGRGRFRRFVAPRRLRVVEELSRLGMLPAIYFIFSRAGCGDAATHVAGAKPGSDHRRRTGGDRPHRQRRHRPPRPGRPRRPRVRPVGGRPGGGGGGASRRDGPGVQGDGGDPVRRRVDQGGVRHRDPGVGDQHAGEGRRAGAAVQVRRRVPRGAPSRRLHPADREGGQARHRSCRHRCRAAPGRDPVRPGGFDRRPGQPPVGVELHAHLQHGGEPGGHVPPPPRRGPGAGVVRPTSPPASSPAGNGPGR